MLPYLWRAAWPRISTSFGGDIVGVCRRGRVASTGVPAVHVFAHRAWISLKNGPRRRTCVSARPLHSAVISHRPTPPPPPHIIYHSYTIGRCVAYYNAFYGTLLLLLLLWLPLYYYYGRYYTATIRVLHNILYHIYTVPRWLYNNTIRHHEMTYRIGGTRDCIQRASCAYNTLRHCNTPLSVCIYNNFNILPVEYEYVVGTIVRGCTDSSVDRRALPRTGATAAIHLGR